MGRGALRRKSPSPALGAGLLGAGEPGTRVRGEAGQGVVQPGLSPVTPRPRSLSHAGSPLCSPLSPAFLLLTHPRPPPHFLAGEGDACSEDGSRPE